MAESGLSRRDFLKASAVGTAGLLVPQGVFASSDATIKVGLIGCGGRGNGAIIDAMNASPDVVCWAIGDVFQDRVDGATKTLVEYMKAKFQATPARRFAGFDAYMSVIGSGVDVVMLTTPPAFRPAHLSAAVAAGKHVFMEKPVAVDGAGIRSVIESAAVASRKDLSIVAGTQRRHDVAYREAMKRIHGGDMGDVVAAYAYWNQGGLWMHPRQEKWSDMEWQLRNWLYFAWLSGDHIVEQHVHNLDVCNWAMQAHPAKCVSLGGRQVRTDKAYGHVFDHFATEYEYPNGVKMLSMCRQQDGTASRVSEHLVGTKGTSDANNSIKGAKAWRFEGERPNPYVEEHKHFFESIRSGKPMNEAKQVAESTLTAIMGRMAAYTGQDVTWEQALNSQENLIPAKLEMGDLSVPSVAMPGVTKLT